MPEVSTDVVTEEAVTGTPASENETNLDVSHETPEGKAIEGAEVKPPEKKEPEVPKKNHDVRRMRKFMERAFTAEGELKAYREMQAQQAAAAQESGEPKRDQYQDDLSYLEARQDHRFKQIEARQQPSQPRNNWVEKEDAARTAIPDFDDVMDEARESGITIPQAAADAIASSILGPEIQYYIAKNPKEAERLWRNQIPVDQIRAIGRIEATIEAKKNSKPVKISAAPKPITPVRANGGEVDIDRDKLSDKDWQALRKKEKINAYKKVQGITT